MDARLRSYEWHRCGETPLCAPSCTPPSPSTRSPASSPSLLWRTSPSLTCGRLSAGETARGADRCLPAQHGFPSLETCQTCQKRGSGWGFKICLPSMVRTSIRRITFQPLLTLNTGNMVYLNILGNHIVAIGDAGLAQELLEKRSANTCDRPSSVVIPL